MLEIDEVVITDSGYADTRCVQPPGTEHALHSTLAKIRARHENVSKRLKQYYVLKHRFRHSLSRQGD